MAGTRWQIKLTTQKPYILTVGLTKIIHDLHNSEYDSFASTIKESRMEWASK